MICIIKFEIKGQLESYTKLIILIICKMNVNILLVS